MSNISGMFTELSYDFNVKHSAEEARVSIIKLVMNIILSFSNIKISKKAFGIGYVLNEPR